MATLIQWLGIWLLAGLLFLVFWRGRLLLSLWREPVLVTPVVIVESDDWGVGPASDAERLTEIAEILSAIRDATGAPAVMTLGVVLGQPDGSHVQASAWSSYRPKSLLEPRFAPIVDAINAGRAAGVFSVQWHGLEHFWPASLLARARHDAKLQEWLMDPNARSEELPSELQSRWVGAAELPTSPLVRADIEAAIGEEAEILLQVFGEVPAVAVPNTFIWNEDVERAWAAAGVACIVTSGRRIEGRSASGALLAPTRRMLNGDRSAVGDAIFVVRDEYFEPIRGHRAEQVWAAVERKSALGRPTLLETHRMSFIASREASHFALQELERALRGVLVRFPLVRFMPTAMLAAHLRDRESPLFERRLVYRLAVFLRRMQEQPELARVLKYSGLSVLLRAGVVLLRAVTYGRFSASAQ